MSFSLRLSRLIKAPRENAFRAWTEPEQIKRWWLAHDFVEPTAEVDLRVGGTFRLGMRPKNGPPFYAVGTFLEVNPPERLVYTWRWEPAGTMDPRRDPSHRRVQGPGPLRDRDDVGARAPGERARKAEARRGVDGVYGKNGQAGHLLRSRKSERGTRK